MKKLLIYIVALPLWSMAQIQVTEMPQKVEVGTAKIMGNPLAYLYYYPGKDTSYHFTFKNCRYSTITEYHTVTFEGAATANDLYNIMISVLNNPDSKYRVGIKLGDTDAILSKEFNGTAVNFFTANGYVNLRRKDVRFIWEKRIAHHDFKQNHNHF